MSLLEKLKPKKSSSPAAGAAAWGVCRGILGGHLGIWARLGKSQTELFRVVVHYDGTSKTGKKQSGSFSYTFSPSLMGDVYQSIEMPRVFKEFLVGKEPAAEAKITVEGITSQGKQQQVFELRPILHCYRLKGKDIPGWVS
ncbi:hypothetical protein EBQ90_00810, partial [bacterium]|nr:hypothetical protein [bacterium]